MQKIKVDVKYATDEERGKILIFKIGTDETDEVICTKETSKTEENQEMMIY